MAKSSKRNLSKHKDVVEHDDSSCSSCSDFEDLERGIGKRSLSVGGQSRTSHGSYQDRLRVYHRDHNNGTDEQCRKVLSSKRSGLGKDSSHHQGSCSSSPDKPQLTKEERKIVQLLAAQSYHLPGNTWWQDWVQYVWTNNHPIVGIFRRHPLHPLKTWSRTVALFGLVLFGLILTNVMYLASTFQDFSSLNDPVVTVARDGNITTADGRTTISPVDAPSAYTVTVGLLLLWTVGGALHTFFSLTIWQMSACACCRSGGRFERCACCPSFGKRLVRLIVLVLLLAATAVILTRASTVTDVDDGTLTSNAATKYVNDTTLDDTNDNITSGILSNATNGTDIYGNETSINGTDSNEINSNDTDSDSGEFWDDPSDTFSSSNSQEGESSKADKRRSFQFLVGYSVELALTMLIYYPIGATILFSGILGFGRLPIFGGRPRDVWIEQEKEKRRQRRQERRESRYEAQQNRKGKKRRSSSATMSLPASSNGFTTGADRSSVLANANKRASA